MRINTCSRSRPAPLTNRQPDATSLPLQIGSCKSLDRLSAGQWQALCGTDHPFLSYRFLAGLERHGCVGDDTGWHPRHVVATDRHGVVGVLPLYEKTHSWGEFVFDWGWAQAHRQAGLAYYPKLVATVPFTPAGTRRFLVRGDADRRQITSCLLEAALTRIRSGKASSLHLLFLDETEREILRDHGAILRKDCQFHWHNRGYSDFEDFLDGFSSAKRKKVRRERRRVAEAGVEFEVLPGHSIDEALWGDIDRFYSGTFEQRGRLPYLSRSFFEDIGHAPDSGLIVILGRRSGQPLAAAICFRSADTLYGRYWGSTADMHSLHFETCYYQGIELCIREGLARFEPGTQGEHKISRGFTPVETWSAHWLADSAFAGAVRHFVEREQEYIDEYIAAVHAHSPYRRETPPFSP
ncbi:GNAT family N-acetyltransferase [soil metagenome]